MEQSKEKKSLADKLSDVFMYWIIFASFLMAAPLLSTMAIHYFLIQDFDISRYTSDILMIAFSITASAISESYQVKEKLTKSSNLFFRVLIVLLMLCMIGVFCVYLVFYGVFAFPLGVIGTERIIRVGCGISAVSFIYGCVISYFED